MGWRFFFQNLPDLVLHGRIQYAVWKMMYKNEKSMLLLQINGAYSKVKPNISVVCTLYLRNHLLQTLIMQAEVRLPTNFTELIADPIIDSSHEINFEIADQVKGKALFSRFAAYDFNGLVWWHDTIGYWAVEIYEWRQYKETWINEYLDELIKEVQVVYGKR
jgi:hypothetical protein